MASGSLAAAQMAPVALPGRLPSFAAPGHCGAPGAVRPLRRSLRPAVRHYTNGRAPPNGCGRFNAIGDVRVRAEQRTRSASPTEREKSGDADLRELQPRGASDTAVPYEGGAVADVQAGGGSVLGAASLVAGTTVGAGALALPAVTEASGFLPSSLALGLTAVFSAMTGLMIAEVNMRAREDTGESVSLNEMTKLTLGSGGAAVSSTAYVFLHYCLLVAYLGKGGELVAPLLGLPADGDPLVPEAVFTLLWGATCYVASDAAMEGINSALVAGVVAAFLALVVSVAGGVDVSRLAAGDWSAVPDALPVIALAFVYQNVVPVISDSLNNDPKKVRQAILIGSAVPLAMFVLWDGAVLGTPSEGGDPLVALLNQPGLAGQAAAAFSLLSLVTSFIGFVLGLTDFAAGILNVPEEDRKRPSAPGRALTFAATLVPPFVASLFLRDVFVKALDYAGTYGVLMLFGVLPPAMLWRSRYGGVFKDAAGQEELTPGGPAALVAVGAVAAAIIGREVVQTISGA
ncbi:unnamed protein product [Pedinophyceae sp. YPF-701]|nr:unnamed protein product [Pedinophyceae sp. YPF-701]